MIAVLLKQEGGIKGVSYHRLYVPFKNLQDKGYNVKFFENLSEMTDQDLQQCRAVVTSRGFMPKVPYSEFKRAMLAFGIQIVLDQDDYWKLDKWHPMYEVFRQTQKEQTIYDSIYHSDWITVTHEKLAKKVTKLDKKKRVLVIPNAIDASQDQWKLVKNESDKLRFGYIAGASHTKDLEELNGYNFKANNKELVVADVMDYKELLGASTVLKTRDTSNYGKLYRDVDVSLAPLKSTEFNKMKSELKVLEAGFSKTAFIGSNIHPYTRLIKNGVNGILCSNEKEWIEAINSLSKERAKELGEELYKTVQEFEINRVNRIREKFFFDFNKD